MKATEVPLTMNRCITKQIHEKTEARKDLRGRRTVVDRMEAVVAFAKLRKMKEENCDHRTEE